MTAMNLYAVALGEPGGVDLDPQECSWIEFYWADDPDHAVEQARDANGETRDVLCVAAVVAAAQGARIEEGRIVL